MLIKIIVICFLYINVDGAALSTKRSPEELFEDFLFTYKRPYVNDPHEIDYRFGIFMKNLKYIDILNERYPFATFGITNLADRTYEERNNMAPALTINYEEMREKTSDIPDYMKLFSSIPKSFDWRDRNCVTPVKDQGGCGSCWAFSTVAAIESQYAIKYKKHIDLSEQQLVDCDTNAHGCIGGHPASAISYVMHNGIVLENDYPYKAHEGDCLNMTGKTAVSIEDGPLDIQTNVSEEVMQHLVATFGPLVVGFHMRDEIFFYESGIMTPLPEECEGEVNHGVLLVGYGVENDITYWIIKNSWGEDFGENGYFKIVRGEEICSINQFIITFDLI